MGMDMVRLHYFTEVARHLSLSKASEVLFLSQPALSRHISAFEKSLGTPLFERGNRGVKLTAAGELLYAESEALLLNENSLLFRLRELNPAHNQTIRIEYTSGNLISKITGFLVHFGAKDQHFIVERTVWDVLLQDLNHGSTNLAICALHELYEQDNICTQLLFSSPSKICLSKWHPLARRERLTIQDIQKDVIMLPNTSLSTKFALHDIVSLGKRYGLTLNVTTEHNSMMAILADVALGRGVAPIIGTFLPGDLPKNLKEGTVLLPCDGLSNIDYGVAWNKSMENQHLLSIIDEMAAYDWA